MSFLKNIFGRKDGSIPPNELSKLKGTPDNPIYQLYCIMGYIDNERNKLQYLDQWMKCYPILDDFMKDCQTKSVSSEQTFRQVTSWSDDGFPQVNIKTAPTGGTLKWGEKNNRKICETHLEELLLQTEQAQKEGISHYDWMQKQFPERDVIINFDRHQVRGRMEAVANLNRYGVNDFIFMLSPYATKPNEHVPNQRINIYITERYVKTVGQEKVDEFVRKIASMAGAVKVGKTRLPASVNEKNQQGKTVTKTLIWRDYSLPSTCSFLPNPAGEWIVIFEK